LKVYQHVKIGPLYCITPQSVLHTTEFLTEQVKEIYAVSKKKSLQFSLNNFNKYKRIFAILGTHYPANVLLKYVKFALKIYLSLSIGNVMITSSKMTFSWKGGITEPLLYEEQDNYGK